MEGAAIPPYPAGPVWPHTADHAAIQRAWGTGPIPSALEPRLNPRANGRPVRKMAQNMARTAVRMARDKRGPP